MANNSVVYEERPAAVEFMEEWLSLARSGTGERGIFNREGMVATSPERRKKAEFGTNPCGEIALRPRQFCNLSIAVARPGDTFEDLKRKVRLAAIFGTLQSTLTKFNYLDERWANNCKEERLLGVDITGQMDCELLRPIPDEEVFRQNRLELLREVATATNREYAGRLGIEASAAVTCVKPSGNSAQLFNCSSGLHPRYAAYYIRRLRIGAYTPIAKLLLDSGIPNEPEVGQSRETASVLVFEYPVASPPGAITRHDLTAVQQLENWLTWKRHYTEHNPSVTIYVEPDEWPTVGAWVWEHFEEIGGLSFLPKDGGLYALAPYEEITKEEYERRVGAFPDVDFGRLSAFEIEDSTEVNREFACTGDRCEL
jgi:ribonucleoside-diphosphate reductase alpha chain